MTDREAAPDARSTVADSAVGPAARATAGRRTVTWLWLAFLSTFGAGVVVGLLVPAAREALAAPDFEDPDELYVREMAIQYGLDSRQVRLLRMVLRARDAEHREVLMHDVEQLPLALRRDIQDVHRRAEERIKSLLTPAQLTRFSQDSRPAPGVGPGRRSAGSGDPNSSRAPDGAPEDESSQASEPNQAIQATQKDG